MSDDLLHNLKFILEHSPGHLYWLDNNNVYQGCNIEQAKSMSLSSPDEIVGKENKDFPAYFASQQLIDQINQANEKVLSSGKELLLEEPLIKLDGSLADVISHKIPLRNADQQIIGLIGISIDITDIKKKVVLADSNQNKLKIAVENIIAQLPGHVYWKNANGVYLGCNNAQAKSLGVNSALDVIGKTDFDLPWKEGDAQKFRENDLSVMRQDKAISLEEEAIFDGRAAIVLSQKIPLKDSKGQVFGVLGISLDITDRKEKERLQLENKLLQENLDTTRLFAASIAHELRTPWGGVLLISGLLSEVMPIFLKSYRRALEAGLLSDERRENLPTEEMIQGALEVEEGLRKSAYAAKIFIDMMLLKVNLKGLEAPVVEALSMVASIDQALELYPLTNTEKKLIHWSRSENQSYDFVFQGDQTLFNHLMFNLIKNAIFYVKYANKGEVLIWLSQENGGHFLHFKDTGAGMSEEVQENLFKAFFSRTRHGTGVGLALCKKIMTDWGGSIECQSVQDEYTHFIMRFPAIKQIE